MKKTLLLAILGVTAGVTACYGQGQINFGNYYSSSQTTGVTYGFDPYDPYPYAGLGVGPECSATLLWGASTCTAISQLSLVAGSTVPFGLGVATGPGAFGTGAGWFDGGTILINGGTDRKSKRLNSSQ